MTRISDSAAIDRVANALTNTDPFASDRKKNSESVQAIQGGLKAFGSAAGPFAPALGMLCSAVSAVIGGVAAICGT